MLEQKLLNNSNVKINNTDTYKHLLKIPEKLKKEVNLNFNINYNKSKEIKNVKNEKIHNYKSISNSSNYCLTSKSNLSVNNYSNKNSNIINNSFISKNNKIDNINKVIYSSKKVSWIDNINLKKDNNLKYNSINKLSSKAIKYGSPLKSRCSQYNNKDCLNNEKDSKCIIKNKLNKITDIVPKIKDLTYFLTESNYNLYSSKKDADSAKLNYNVIAEESQKSILKVMNIKKEEQEGFVESENIKIEKDCLDDTKKLLLNNVYFLNCLEKAIDYIENSDCKIFNQSNNNPNNNNSNKIDNNTNNNINNFKHNNSNNIYNLNTLLEFICSNIDDLITKFMNDENSRLILKGILIILYFLNKKYLNEIQEDQKLKLISKLLESLNSFELIDQTALILIIEVISLFESNEYIVESIDLFEWLIINYNDLEVKRASFKLIFQLGNVGIHTLLNLVLFKLSNNDLNNNEEYNFNLNNDLQMFLIELLLNTDYIKKLIVVKAILNDFKSNIQVKINTSLDILDKFLDVLNNDDEALDYLVLTLLNANTNKLKICEIIAKSNRKDKLIEFLIKYSDPKQSIVKETTAKLIDYQTKIAVLSAISIKVEKMPVKYYIKVTKDNSKEPGKFLYLNNKDIIVYYREVISCFKRLYRLELNHNYEDCKINYNLNYSNCSNYIDNYNKILYKLKNQRYFELLCVKNKETYTKSQVYNNDNHKLTSLDNNINHNNISFVKSNFDYTREDNFLKEEANKNNKIKNHLYVNNIIDNNNNNNINILDFNSYNNEYYVDYDSEIDIISEYKNDINYKVREIVCLCLANYHMSYSTKALNSIEYLIFDDNIEVKSKAIWALSFYKDTIINLLNISNTDTINEENQLNKLNNYINPIVYVIKNLKEYGYNYKVRTSCLSCISQIGFISEKYVLSFLNNWLLQKQSSSKHLIAEAIIKTGDLGISFLLKQLCDNNFNMIELKLVITNTLEHIDVESINTDYVCEILYNQLSSSKSVELKLMSLKTLMILYLKCNKKLKEDKEKINNNYVYLQHHSSNSLNTSNSNQLFKEVYFSEYLKQDTLCNSLLKVIRENNLNLQKRALTYILCLDKFGENGIIRHYDNAVSNYFNNTKTEFNQKAKCKNNSYIKSVTSFNNNSVNLKNYNSNFINLSNNITKENKDYSFITCSLMFFCKYYNIFNY